MLPLWSEKMLEMISVLLNLLRLVLWPSMCSILENVPCALEKNVYSAALGWNALYISVKSIWSNVWLKACVSLLIFCPNDQFIDESGVLKSPTIIVSLSVSPFMVVSICLIYWGAVMLGAYIFTVVISSSWIVALLCSVLLCPL